METTTRISKRALKEALGMGHATEGHRSIEFTLPVKPVPCPRPRHTRQGLPYYPKTYVNWRRAAQPHVAPVHPIWETENLLMIVESVLPKFKTVQRSRPQYDVDNFAKSVLDIVTKSKLVWKDDDQVISLLTLKRFVEGDEEPHNYVFIREA